MNEHELVKLLKEMALELGRVPTRQELEMKVRGVRYALTKAFGTYTALKQAAGFTEEAATRKIDNTVFEKSIDEHVQAHKPPEYTPRAPYPSALIISDLHWPFHCQRVVDAFLKRVGEVKPEWVILNGDAWDFYSHGKFPRSHMVFTPDEEEKLCSKLNKEFWEKVRALSPKSKCVQLFGNHDLRPMRKVLTVYPEAASWIEDRIKTLFAFEGVRLIEDPREELMLADDIAVFHGYRSQLGAHRDYTLMSCVNGHSHTGGVVFRMIRNGVLFELNSGYAGDPSAKGLTYTPQKITHWTPGFGELDALGPRFIPA